MKNFLKIWAVYSVITIALVISGIVTMFLADALFGLLGSKIAALIIVSPLLMGMILLTNIKGYL